VIQLLATEEEQNKNKMQTSLKKAFNMTFLCIFKISFILPNLKLEQSAKKNVCWTTAGTQICPSFKVLS